MTGAPDWYYDDLRQVGLDFEDPEEVAAYDARQGHDPETEEDILGLLDLEAGQRLIDIGCGTGRLVRAAARRGIEATGFDVSTAMLGHAAAEAERERLPAATFRQGGFLSLTWEEAPVDAVTCSFSLHHLPDFWKQIAFLRIAALLAPEGRFLLRDVAFSFPPERYAEGVEAWLDQQSRTDGSGFSRADFAAHVREEHSTFTWILEGMLQRAGFEIEFRELAGGAYADYLCIRRT